MTQPRAPPAPLRLCHPHALVRPGRPGHQQPANQAPTGSRRADQRVRARRLTPHVSAPGRVLEPDRLLDPYVEAATEDAYDLSARVARGEGRLFRVGLYLSVHAASQQALADEVAALRSVTASLLLDAKPTTYRSLQGWVTALPMGLDLIGMRRTFDTSALAAAFPFISP